MTITGHSKNKPSLREIVNNNYFGKKVNDSYFGEKFENSGFAKSIERSVEKAKALLIKAGDYCFGFSTTKLIELSHIYKEMNEEADLISENLYNLKQAGENAQNKYSQITSCNKNLKPNIIENDINIFPNPTNESINITCNNLDFNDFLITLYNVEGNIINLNNNITYKHSKHIVINCTNLPKGIYFINIKNNNKTYNQKMVVIH